MYKIIGADKKEYGPVTSDQIRDWVRQGRANASTLVQAEGTTEWKTLSAIPEFAPLFVTQPIAPPPISHIEAENLAQEILSRGYRIDASHCISRAWEMVKSDFWPIVGVSALGWVLIWAVSAMYVGILIVGPLMGGLFLYYLKKIRREQASIEDLFAGFKFSLLQLFLGGLVTTVLESLGFLCLILPGIYLSVAWCMALPLIIDKKFDFWPAMEASRKIISSNWWNIFGLFVLMFLVNLLGVLACGVGFFISLPVTSIAWMYAYEDIFRRPTTVQTV